MIIWYIKNNWLTKKIPTVICATTDTVTRFTKCTVSGVDKLLFLNEKRMLDNKSR